MTLNPSLRGLAISLLLSIVPLLLWSLYRQPGHRQAWQELRSLQADVAARASSLIDVDRGSTILEERVSAAEAELQASRMRYPIGLTEAGLIREFERRTRVHRLDVEALTLAERDGPPGVVHWTVDLRVTGRYADLMSFADSLETPDRAQALESLKLSVHDDPEILAMHLRYLLASRANRDTAGSLLANDEQHTEVNR